VVDTLRADALGTYGGPPTPALDRLAARGAVFEEAIAPSSWTLPSMASLLSGTYPARHGFTEFNGDLDADGSLGLPSLASEFQHAGWATRAVVGNTLLDPAAGFARGFELYDAYDFEPQSRLWLNLLAVRCLRAAGLLAPGVRRVPVPVLTGRFPFVDTRLAFYNLDEDLTDRALRHALPPPADRPLFLYVHYIAPHAPYLPHPLDLLKQVPAPEHTDPELLRAR
jgi:arylsulfatase A-like enzyme